MEKLATVGDVGLAINPALAEGQDIGAATMGMGIGLFEELVYDGPQLVNGSILDYRLPRRKSSCISCKTRMASVPTAPKAVAKRR